MIPTLTTQRLTLRPLGLQDFPALCAFFDSDRARYVGGRMTAEMTWRHLACEIGHWTLMGFGRWAVDLTETGAFVGVAGLWCPNGFPEPELGWDLMAGFEGKGYATEAGIAARDYAFDTLGMTTLISLVAYGNDGSARVAERLGAVNEGDFTHQRHGKLRVYRHPNPQQQKQEQRHAGQ